MLADTFRFLSIFFGALLAGSMAMELAMIIPAMRSVTVDAAVQMHKALSPLGFRYILPAGVVAGLAAVALLIVDHHFWDAATTLALVGVIIMNLGLLMTIVFYAPIDATLKTWSGNESREQAAPLLQRWHRIHVFRTLFYVVGVACFILAALAS